jgi:hypothetical protein
MDMKKSVYQFKVSLKGIKPLIWRRIEVPAAYTFWDLHVAIQDSMGWFDSHLHAFRIPNRAGRKVTMIGIPDDGGFDDDPITLPGWEVPISEHFTKKGDKADYEYDFGDGWEHKVVLEKIVDKMPNTKYPRCLAGARACPHEDCGGTGGYANLLEIISDPSDEEYQDMLEWLGGKFDPEHFDPREVRFDDPGKRWKRTFSGG